MKKALLPLLLAAALLLSVPAQAANDSMGNFVRTRRYTGQFSDLAADSVFYDNVSTLYEYGLSNGRSDGTYGLQDPMSLGEICIFAGRIRSLYRTGDPEAGPRAYITQGQPLSAGYLAYLHAEGVVGNEISGRSDRMRSPSPRWEVAHLLANVLPKKELSPINESAVEAGYYHGGYIPDLRNGIPYLFEILTLYKAGICGGSDEMGSFRPEEPITRGAAAAMLTRLADPSLRLTLDWAAAEKPEPQPVLPASPAGTTSGADTTGTAAYGQITYGDLVAPGRYVATPTTGSELDETIRHMLAANSNQLLLRYPGISAMQVRSLMDAALRAVKVYCEQSYNSVSCTFDALGNVTMTFSASYASDAQIARYRAETLASALAVRQALWDSGVLRSSMTEREKARVYFTWICDNCVYDDTAGDESLSHLAYGLFTSGTAVCDGYTGAYNLFLRLEGIDCIGLSNEDHIWTVAELDGRLVHIDTTWGDTGGTPDYSFFAMTPDQSWSQHRW